MEDIRWKYRFDNYTKSFEALKRSLNIKNPSEVERGGVIQFYEMAFELAWKTIKDYLEYEGFDIKSPRAAIKLGIQRELLSNGHDWMDALNDRNLTTHTYDEATAISVYQTIKNTYFPLLESLFEKLKNER